MGESYTSQVMESYALGAVAGSGNYVAALVASNSGSGSQITASFAREQPAVPLVALTIGGGAQDVASALLPLAGFATAATFDNAGWDFEDVWEMSGSDGRPLLR